MPLILSLETATSVCSAALHESGRLLGVIELHEDQTHGAKLAVIVGQLFETFSVKPDDLSAVAVSGGPGSYTGLRIGASTAKGLAVSLGVPLISIDTLTILAATVDQTGIPYAFLCPMLDARRMEVYSAVYSRGLARVEEPRATVVEADSYAQWLSQGAVLFFGNGAAKCRPILTSPAAVFLSDIYPSARILGNLAYQNFLHNRFEDVVSYEPFYLKEFQLRRP